jgi:hypothetical protein
MDRDIRKTFICFNRKLLSQNNYELRQVSGVLWSGDLNRSIQRCFDQDMNLIRYKG